MDYNKIPEDEAERIKRYPASQGKLMDTKSMPEARERLMKYLQAQDKQARKPDRSEK